MDENKLYKGWSFEPASEKRLNGKYFPQGQIIKKLEGGETKVMKTFSEEYSTKTEADSAFIKLAKEHIDATYT